MQDAPRPLGWRTRLIICSLCVLLACLAGWALGAHSDQAYAGRICEPGESVIVAADDSGAIACTPERGPIPAGFKAFPGPTAPVLRNDPAYRQYREAH